MEAYLSGDRDSIKYTKNPHENPHENRHEPKFEKETCTNFLSHEFFSIRFWELFRDNFREDFRDDFCEDSKVYLIESQRREYASMDVSAMGVDVEEGPTTALDNKIKEEKMRESVDELDKYIR